MHISCTSGESITIIIIRDRKIDRHRDRVTIHKKTEMTYLLKKV
jgi:hypothetical protein